MLSSKHLAWLFAALLLATTSTASAMSFTIGVEGGPDWDAAQMSVGEWSTSNGGEVRHWSLASKLDLMDENDQKWGEVGSWDISLKEDPFVVNNINVTNTSGFTQIFIVSVVMPIPAFNYDRVVFSSVAVTATDSNGDNQLLVAEDGGTAFYRGRVNNVTILPLTPPNMPLTTADCAPPNTPGCTTNSATGVASMNVTPGTATQLELVLRFALSSGDSVGITSRFEIVPEPGTALLLGLGLVGLAARRRAGR